MFMCAVARPVYGENGDLLIDGKIGVWPFIEHVPAARKSKHWEVGTIVTKAVESIIRQVTKDCIIQKIIPAIKAKWLANASKTIFIQQDNARPDISDLDPDFRTAVTSDGLYKHFRMMKLPLQSTVDELVNNVMTAFIDHESMKLNFNYLTLQSVMVEIMKCRGHNDFKIPHMSKESLLRQGILLTNLTIDAQLVRECLEYLDANGNGSAPNELREGVTQLFTVHENHPGEGEMLQMIEATEVDDVWDLFWFDV
ncbi:uncharacterized protein LOC141620210 [Silene latifolia]|uniref:uncharacterized protein LOC141620210 n=1 Tax=Silene latifolia TaxID=37657 RepID=UPI003D779F25